MSWSLSINDVSVEEIPDGFERAKSGAQDSQAPDGWAEGVEAQMEAVQEAAAALAGTLADRERFNVFAAGHAPGNDDEGGTVSVSVYGHAPALEK